MDSRPPGGERWQGSEEPGNVEQQREHSRSQWDARDGGSAGNRASKWRTDDRETWTPSKDRYVARLVNLEEHSKFGRRVGS